MELLIPLSDTLRLRFLEDNVGQVRRGESTYLTPLPASGSLERKRGSCNAAYQAAACTGSGHFMRSVSEPALAFEANFLSSHFMKGM